MIVGMFHVFFCVCVCFHDALPGSSWFNPSSSTGVMKMRLSAWLMLALHVSASGESATQLRKWIGSKVMGVPANHPSRPFQYWNLWWFGDPPLKESLKWGSDIFFCNLGPPLLAKNATSFVKSCGKWWLNRDKMGVYCKVGLVTVHCNNFRAYDGGQNELDNGVSATLCLGR